MVTFWLIVMGIFGGMIWIMVWSSRRGSAFVQQDSEGYMIENVPKDYKQAKLTVDKAFPKLFWKDVPGRDDGIYKELKLFGKYSGLGPIIGITIKPIDNGGGSISSNIFISLVHWETHDVLLMTYYIGADKSHKYINKLRKLFGDPSLIETAQYDAGVESN